ncbi:putative monovalent cation/H+ antiporter subunit A [Myroides injenensis]|uniref:putative monovalent cation/H+ antiporter subunit A n=1 Tax=Myroides injenensis TaxID=1183151 RepID=UPI0002881F7D|nr:putative monovalent cation/H+ antiporter subunit A [Myroides injenensis]
MLIVILLTFVFAFIALFMGKHLHSKYSGLTSLLPFSIFIYLLTFIPIIKNNSEVIYRTSWVESMGISLDFKIDGLSLLFGLLISGIGTLIFLYTSSYLKGHQYLDRFYCYLTLFMGAMLGVVMSDNLITLFIFWELTSISSFFLIGFNNEEEESRKSALWALSITGLGGFFLLGFSVIINSLVGTYSISELLTYSDVIKGSSFYIVAIVFLFVAAFTKSAQFPFHFWLPGAMKAPTPVSAYLHSATMVKAGVYLIARFTPILGGEFYWNNTLLIVGGITMIYGAFHCIFRKDMKGILAYSTISALGMLMFLLGIGTALAIQAACVFIVVHALYKAALFLITGTIDHSLHTRDINVLGGLRTLMPWLAVSGIIAALSCAGIPLTFGFIGKELIYEAALDYPIQSLAIVVVVVAVLTNVFLLCSGLLVGVKPFFGKLEVSLCHYHKPDTYLWIPPLVLSFFTVLFGLFPSLIYDGVIFSMTSSVVGEAIDMPLAIWHGFNEAFMLSLGTIIAGILVYLFVRRRKNMLQSLHRFDGIAPENIFIAFAERVRRLAYRYTSLFQNGYLRGYLMVIILFFIGLVGYKLFKDVPLQVNTTGLSEFRVYELIVFLITVAAVLFTINTSSRLTAIASTGVVGYCICLIFVFYGAPDLAMTQFAIDTLTAILFVLVLFKLPGFLKLSNTRLQIRDAIVSIAFGGLISLITLQALVSPADKEISQFYADNAYVLAKGKNVVNVILVDFRGFDTLIETIVLSIAALGVFSLLKYNAKDDEGTTE